MRIVRSSRVVWLALLAVVSATSGAWGAVSLVDIGVLTPAQDGGIPESRIYAVSPDGTWAVGASNGSNVAGTSTMSQAIIWSSSSGLVQIPNNPAPDPELATSARGVLTLGNGDLVVAGYYNAPGFPGYRMASYVTTPGNLTGGTWSLAPGGTSGGGPPPAVGPYNAARPYDTGTGTQWGIAGYRTTTRGVVSLPAAGTYFDSGVLTGYNRMYNVASRVPTGTNRGFAAGYERNNTTLLRRALFGIGGATQTPIPGGAGYQSEALGMSPYTTNVADSGVIVGYDQDNTPDHFSHPFYYVQGAAGMVILPELSGDNQGEAIDARVIGGNMLIGGFTSDGTTEKAVLWDSTGIWDGSGQPMLLTALLTSAGVDVSAWSSLSRVTTMSDDGKTVAGWGIWAADGTVRGFVATIPEPSAMLLLVGTLPILRRRRAH